MKPGYTHRIGSSHNAPSHSVCSVNISTLDSDPCAAWHMKDGSGMTNPNPHTIQFGPEFGDCATLAWLDPFQCDARTRNFHITVRDFSQGDYTANCSEPMALSQIKGAL